MIRQGMQRLIDWPKQGFLFLEPADSGIAALARCQSLPVDVLITDITMPRMSGLELIERLKALDFHPVFIVLSGYSEFEYARRAIQLSVFNYLLKPVNEAELIAMLAQIKAALDQSNFVAAAYHNMLGEIYRRSDKKILQEMLLHIETHLAADISLQYMGDRFHLSPNYISQLFKRELDVNFVDLLTAIRMEKARMLLDDATLKTYEIAGRVGYDDVRYFGQVFKRYTGKTPAEYRNTGRPKDGGAP